MTIAALIIGAFSLAIWVYLLFAHGRFWQSGPVLANRSYHGGARVAVVIPARDEAAQIEAVLTSLLQQEFGGELSIVLVDDNSTDGTGDIARSLHDPRLEVVKGLPLKTGWSGKMWAVSQGLLRPQVAAADYVLLTDADIVHAPGHVAQLVAKAEADGLDLVSEMVRLNCTTLAEKALIPAFVFFFQSLYPFKWVADPARRMAGAAGGTMLVSQRALIAVEGVNRIRNELIDDCALAAEIKPIGTIWLGHAEQADSRRIYAGPSDIWRMIARTAYVQLRRSPLVMLGACVAMGVTYLAPPLLLLAGGLPLVLGLAAWLMMAYAFQPTLRRYRRAPWWGLALPLIALFYLAATIASAVAHYRGRGGAWKARVYNDEVTL
jgi:hopene-associated glycosyltransferase HpnB